MKAVLALLAAALAMGGCATSPETDRQLGSSLRQLRAAQVLAPGAGQRAAVVAGIDAEAARSIYDNYQRSYRSPERTVNNGSTVGAGIGSR